MVVPQRQPSGRILAERTKTVEYALSDYWLQSLEPRAALGGVERGSAQTRQTSASP